MSRPVQNFAFSSSNIPVCKEQHLYFNFEAEGRDGGEDGGG